MNQALVKQSIKVYQDDPNQALSINRLKEIRRNIKKTIKNPPLLRTTLCNINNAIRYKQALYFQFCQHIVKFQWGMSLNKAKLR